MIATLSRPRTAPPTGGVVPSDGLYFMSNEVPRTGAVLTDDQRRGSWYLVDADHTTWQTTPPGWAGTIFANPITPTGAVNNLQSIGKRPLFATSDYAATTGILDGVSNQRNNALHNLSGGGSGGYNELYCRAYMFFVPANYYGAGNPSADYSFGAQKVFTINRWNDDGGIYWAGVGLNIGSGSAISTGTMAVVDNHGSASVWSQNQGVNISFGSGHWYYVEWHIKLNTDGNANGVWELWINDGGATGDFSSQSPVLRARYTNVTWGYTSSELQLMGNIWFENWSNPIGSGEQFWSNIYAATTGPIGFIV